MTKLLPNLITTLRLVLTLPIFVMVWFAYFEPALYLFILAAVSDALDGYLARRYLCVSQYGAVVDPVADKLLVILAAGALTKLGAFPPWLFTVMMLRDVGIGSFAFVLGRAIGWDKLRPRMLSKVNTFTQLIVLTMLLVNLSWFSIPLVIRDIFIWLLFLTTITSFVDYLLAWRELWHHRRPLREIA